MAKAPAGYLRSLPAQLAVIPLSWSMDQNNYGDGKVLLDSPNAAVATERTARALTSSKNGRIWDIDVVKALDILDPDVWKVPAASYASSDPKQATTLYASDRDVFIFLVNEDNAIEVPGTNGEDRLYRGFFAWNSEVGNSTLGLCTFGFNTVCGNHIVWGATDINQFTIVHRSGAPRRFDDELIPMLHDYANASMKPMEEAVTRAIGYRLPKRDDHWWKKLVGSKRFTKVELASAIDYAKREEGQCATLWDLVQGFTASAREYSHIDARVSLEKRSGKLLDIVKDSSTAVLV